MPNNSPETVIENLDILTEAMGLEVSKQLAWRQEQVRGRDAFVLTGIDQNAGSELARKIKNVAEFIKGETRTPVTKTTWHVDGKSIDGVTIFPEDIDANVLAQVADPVIRAKEAAANKALKPKDVETKFPEQDALAFLNSLGFDKFNPAVSDGKWKMEGSGVPVLQFWCPAGVGAPKITDIAESLEVAAGKMDKAPVASFKLGKGEGARPGFASYALFIDNIATNPADLERYRDTIMVTAGEWVGEINLAMQNSKGPTLRTVETSDIAVLNKVMDFSGLDKRLVGKPGWEFLKEPNGDTSARLTVRVPAEWLSSERKDRLSMSKEAAPLEKAATAPGDTRSAILVVSLHGRTVGGLKNLQIIVTAINPEALGQRAEALKEPVANLTANLNERVAQELKDREPKLFGSMPRTL